MQIEVYGHYSAYDCIIEKFPALGSVCSNPGFAHNRCIHCTALSCLPLKRSHVRESLSDLGCIAGIPALGTLSVFAAIQASLTNPAIIAQLAQVRDALLVSTDGPDTVVTIA